MSIHNYSSHSERFSHGFRRIDPLAIVINEGNFLTDLSNTGTLTGEGSLDSYWWLDTPASYHGDVDVLSFADGHAERHQWLERTTLGSIGRTGFRRTSASEREISWLQQHTAERVNGQ